MSAIGGGNAFDPRFPRRIGLKLEEKTDAAREALFTVRRRRGISDARNVPKREKEKIMQRRNAIRMLGVLTGVLASGVAPQVFADPWSDRETGRRYDRSGSYEGRVDEDGRRYDAQGRYEGRVDSNGRAYDRSGRYLGRVDSDGRSYDAQGRYTGRQDSSGRIYDRSGRYQGRVDEDGRRYDAQGRYVGQSR